ncbi:Hypothetical protein, putative [Bodo saltans]|uniref:Uncharacterized protein n=1 Tax=Bodo saltans TaxID=75058 RepID=A0A0S4IMR8_BODSA|nr:Hypothetical protein, putative [Bodo saltans]|eukprot:CUE74563.1 Hypothetical protein, putative [Bodo saltans]
MSEVSNAAVALVMQQHRTVWVDDDRLIHPTKFRVDRGLRLAIKHKLSGDMCRFRMRCTNVACNYLHFASKTDDELDIELCPPSRILPRGQRPRRVRPDSATHDAPPTDHRAQKPVGRDSLGILDRAC